MQPETLFVVARAIKKAAEHVWSLADSDHNKADTPPKRINLYVTSLRRELHDIKYTTVELYTSGITAKATPELRSLIKQLCHQSLWADAGILRADDGSPYSYVHWRYNSPLAKHDLQACVQLTGLFRSDSDCLHEENKRLADEVRRELRGLEMLNSHVDNLIQRSDVIFEQVVCVIEGVN